ncbi:MAG: hypothetical protein R2856_28535 [Caldilineaceae bacterium]
MYPLSPFPILPTGRDVAHGKTILIFDTTLPLTGKPGRHLNEQGRWRSCVNNVALGVDIMEAGFPAASPATWRGQAHRRDCGAHARVDKNGQTVAPPIIAGLARANRSDITKAWEAVAPAVRPRIRLHRHLRHPHGAQAA